MAYDTEIFEKVAHKCGYIIESIKKNAPQKVESMRGAIIEGSLIKRVWWNAEGKCFSYRRTPLPKYDLQLEDKE